MGKMYWIRVVFMVVILAAVLWSMRRLNHGGFPDRGSETALNLCPSRIAWMESATDGAHIEQRQNRWMRTLPNSESAELDPIAVEKWLSRFCSVAIQGITDNASLEPALTVGYVAQSPTVVLRTKSGTYQAFGKSFQSGDLDEVLHKLPELPAIKSPGSP
jgi:hypothetical protein